MCGLMSGGTESWWARSHGACSFHSFLPPTAWLTDGQDLKELQQQSALLPRLSPFSENFVLIWGFSSAWILLSLDTQTGSHVSRILPGPQAARVFLTAAPSMQSREEWKVNTALMLTTCSSPWAALSLLQHQQVL
jgi:hypothetical protein